MKRKQWMDELCEACGVPIPARCMLCNSSIIIRLDLVTKCLDPDCMSEVVHACKTIEDGGYEPDSSDDETPAM